MLLIGNKEEYRYRVEICVDVEDLNWWIEFFEDMNELFKIIVRKDLLLNKIF